MAIVLLFPTTPQVEPATMNYSVVVLGGVTILSVLYYYFPKYGGIHWFRGPVVTLEDNGESESIHSVDREEKQA